MRQDETSGRRFVVGLGNPGRRYAATRHNAGFRVVEALTERWSAGPGRSAFGGVLHEASPGGVRTMLLMPQTFMNNSGRAVQQMAAFYKAPPHEILVVLDDMALEPGRLRARADGSAGGHNGLADVLAAMGTELLPRLRIGIGSPPAGMDPADYVLTGFGEADGPLVDKAVETAAQAVEDWVFKGLQYVMDRYNRKVRTQDEEQNRK